MRSPFEYFNSSPEVIRLAVMLYVRYPLSCWRHLSIKLVETSNWREIVATTAPGENAAAKIRRRSSSLQRRRRSGPVSNVIWDMLRCYVCS